MLSWRMITVFPMSETERSSTNLMIKEILDWLDRYQVKDNEKTFPQARMFEYWLLQLIVSPEKSSLLGHSTRQQPSVIRPVVFG
jgi:hypothetical protein